jgi:hypothetical protein
VRHLAHEPSGEPDVLMFCLEIDYQEERPSSTTQRRFSVLSITCHARWHSVDGGFFMRLALNMVTSTCCKT